MKKLLLFLVMAVLFASCGKKEETQTTNKTDEEQLIQSQQNQTQQQTNEQTKKDATLKEDNQKEDANKKVDADKKEEADKKGTDKNLADKKTDTKDATQLNKIETKNASEMDFAPIFAKRCAKCHGKDLKGKKDGGPNLTADSVQNAPDSKLFKIISEGVKAKNDSDENMPSFKKKFSEDEIHAAIKFIKAH
jgi:cytochrome c553